MVRIKERYLLVNIVYPEEQPENAKVPDFVVYNQPTSDHLTHSILVRAIKAEVRALFGDHGAGAIERNLHGEDTLLSLITTQFWL